jgi:hypothetical protein
MYHARGSGSDGGQDSGGRARWGERGSKHDDAEVLLDNIYEFRHGLLLLLPFS